MMKIQLKGVGFVMMFILLAMTVQAMTLKGVVTDKTNKEPLTGATMQIHGSTQRLVIGQLLYTYRLKRSCKE